jgi:hypothetical protein
MVMLDHYARTVSFYRAILVLLQRKRFLDEPLSLARFLFEDALALRVVADMSEAHRVDAIYSWELDGINRAIGLMAHDAESAEIGTKADHAAVISALNEQRESRTRYWTKHGSGERRYAFGPKAKEILTQKAFDLGERSAWWMYQAADSSVHGNLLARDRRRKQVGPDMHGVFVNDFKPEAGIDVLVFASHAAVIAHEAIFEVFTVDSQPTRLRPALDELDELAWSP